MPLISNYLLMGFDKNGTRLLLHTQQQKVDFSKTLTIGRQGLHLSDMALEENLREFGFQSVNAADLRQQSNGFAEPFLQLLGAKTVDAMDASNYESASIVHDLNRPIDAALKGQYSVVLDGGSLEHVFNFPLAIRNCMEMVQVGGHFIGITACNNYVGHGFYQFSPELFYRIFAPENGFEVTEMIFYTDAPYATWYRVSDPVQVKSRVGLLNSYGAYLFVVAKKIAEKEIFAQTPQQSDYAANWQSETSETKKLNKPSQASKMAWLPVALRRFLLRWQYRIRIFKTIFKEIGTGNPDFFNKQ